MNLWEKNRIISNFYKEKIENETNNFMHSSYQLEKKLLKAIKLKNEAEALKTLKTINKNMRARLATNSIRSLKNSVICSCTLFIRAGIEGGFHAESAYNLSDVFIMKIEMLETKKDIENFEIFMIQAIIEQLNKKDAIEFNGIVSRTIDYIHDNIFQSLNLEEISKEMRMNASYLSSLFKKETSYSLIEYINLKKIEESKYFLTHTDISISEIASLFSFCNQSYYTLLFKRYNGITPAKFKNKNYIFD